MSIVDDPDFALVMLVIISVMIAIAFGASKLLKGAL